MKTLHSLNSDGPAVIIYNCIMADPSNFRMSGKKPSVPLTRSNGAVRLVPESDGRWYKDAIVYEIHVRAYSDGNGDGIGDLPGLITKLDYLRDLGVSALWLLPFYPSPLRDDGYDIADYTSIHPDYGTLADFRRFLREAHKRGLRVITELVLNHTSDQHQWFQRARRSTRGSTEREFYVWSDTTDRYKDARIIFADFETSNWTWDPVAGAYYWHRFYRHQPDLNYDNPAVIEQILRIIDFWLDMGIDGFRLDAVPYLLEREGTNCENLPETHQLLRDIRLHMDRKYDGRMLLAEANQWPEDAVSFFGTGDECHMAFHFPLMPRLFMALRMEDRYPVIDILHQTPQIPDSCQWALFLRNHDELTLEMVTDEERDYMFRVYAHDPRARLNLGIRRRLAPLLGNGRRRIELMNGILFSLPGTPHLYYGDEIGMGDNIYLGDRNGVRTPMQWSSDRNAGFSRANAQKLYLPVIIDPECHYEAINVEAQLNNPGSLLWWMRRLIALRKRTRAFGRGTLKVLNPENRKVLSYIRDYEGETVLVVANLSRFTQFAELDLSEFNGCRPVEMFGHTRFPAIGDRPYFLTLGPHNFYWFVLEPPRASGTEAGGAGERAHVVAGGEWNRIFSPERKHLLERILPDYLAQRRWYRGKDRTPSMVEIVDTVPIGDGRPRAVILLVRVRYTEGDPEMYSLPLAYIPGKRGRRLQHTAPLEVLTQLATSEGEGVLTGAPLEKDFCEALWKAVAHRRQFRGRAGTITATPTRSFRKIIGAGARTPTPGLLEGERGNISILFGKRAVLKLFRRLEEGRNPEQEIGTFLTDRVPFPHAPHLAGFLEYRSREGEPMSLGVLQGYVANEGDAWHYTVDILERFYERMASRPLGGAAPKLPARSPLEAAEKEIPDLARDLIGVYLESARLLGLRTAEFHVALSSVKDDPAFTAEPFTSLYQRSIFQSLRNQADQVFDLLKKRVDALPEEFRASAVAVVARKEEVIARYRSALRKKISALKTRIHGNYWLGEVLHTGKDFVIVDFEGRPACPLGTRRIKRSPLHDAAGMVYSFRNAAHTALGICISAGGVPWNRRAVLKRYAEFWIFWVSTAFLQAYLRAAAAGSFLPRDISESASLLDMYLLETAIIELGDNLSERPERAVQHLAEISRILGNRQS